jgi:hypothetical protein
MTALQAVEARAIETRHHENRLGTNHHLASAKNGSRAIFIRVEVCVYLSPPAPGIYYGFNRVYRISFEPFKQAGR